MILAKTYYKLFNIKLLAIVNMLQNWRYYLKDYKSEVLV